MDSQSTGKDLQILELYNKQTASGVLELIEARQVEFLKKYGSRVVFAADEFYLTAQKEIPNADYYEDYPQYENGVGLLRSLIDEFDFALKTTEWSGKPLASELSPDMRHMIRFFLLLKRQWINTKG